MLAVVITVVLAIAGLGAYFISLMLRRKLAKSGNSNAMLFSVLTFIGCFLIILAAIFFIIVYNMSFER